MLKRNYAYYMYINQIFHIYIHASALKYYAFNQAAGSTACTDTFLFVSDRLIKNYIKLVYLL